MQNSQAGSVVALWRYPVKSMMGEELNSSEVTQRGLLGDRAYALVDAETGKVASAKNPRRWPRLFDFRAVYTEPPRKGEKSPPVRITLPDGTICLSEQPDVQAVLSAALGRTATLTLTLPQGDLPQDHGILRAAAQHNDANVGVYAMVVQPGLVRRGDAVRVVE